MGRGQYLQKPDENNQADLVGPIFKQAKSTRLIEGI